MKNGLARRRIKRPQRSAARRVKKRSASWTNSELRAVMTEYQPYKAARTIHTSVARVESSGSRDPLGQILQGAKCSRRGRTLQQHARMRCCHPALHRKGHAVAHHDVELAVAVDVGDGNFVGTGRGINARGQALAG